MPTQPTTERVVYCGGLKPEVSGGDLITAADVAHDLFAIDGHRQRTTHAHVVERWASDVETIGISAKK